MFCYAWVSLLDQAENWRSWAEEVNTRGAGGRRTEKEALCRWWGKMRSIEVFKKEESDYERRIASPFEQAKNNESAATCFIHSGSTT